MSLWKFGSFEEEVDFNDADFLDALEYAKKVMDLKLKEVPKVGKRSEIVRAQCRCFYAFFDTLFGEGAGNAIFEGRSSLELCIQAADSISEFQKSEDKRIEQTYSKYQVQNHGNRQQRRQYQKTQKTYHPKYHK